MAISTNYPVPVLVNGFSCKNCTDVGEAAKFIDPAHPKAGPFGINAKSDPTETASPAFKLSGVLATARSTSGNASQPQSSTFPSTRSRVDVYA